MGRRKMGKTGEFNHKEIILFGLGCLLLGLFVGTSFGHFKKMKYTIYKEQLIQVEKDYKKHMANRDTLQGLISEYIMTKITDLKTKKLWHKCHSTSVKGQRFGSIVWKKKPQMIVGQTKMTVSFKNGPNQPIYDAKPVVTIAENNTSYDVTLPASGSTEVCVLFIPNEEDQAPA